MTRRRQHRSGATTAVGLAAGFILDSVVGDPRRWHPVAGLGTISAALERRLYADSRIAGTVFAGSLIGGAAAAGWLAEHTVRRSRSRAATIALTAAVTWAALGGTTLTRIGDEAADALAATDIDRARTLVPSLCSRDPAALDADGIARAALESIAENTSDATVGPLLWGAVGGVPGLMAYRTVNTLDAMVGYRNERYLRFGWAAARLDDLANLIPARVAGTLAVLLGPNPRAAAHTWRRDARRHPSPNAGVVEASFAGALGVRLGGRTVYAHGAEERPALGDGNPPGFVDLAAAVRLSRRVQIGAVILAVALAAVNRRNAR
ncbi:MAG: cobalamin biosynthesis protein [Gordonia sp. (in: high G+C Gram-positive bacteria)]